MATQSKATTTTEPVPVTADNFNRAESHMYFNNSLKGGGSGKFHHVRDIIPIDNQTVIRANRDVHKTAYHCCCDGRHQVGMVSYLRRRSALPKALRRRITGVGRCRSGMLPIEGPS